MAIHDYGRKEPPEGERLWTTEEVREEFEVIAFRAPLVRVRRKEDDALGWMEFTHMPRFYFGFRTDEELEEPAVCSLCGDTTTSYAEVHTDEGVRLFICRDCDDGE